MYGSVDSHARDLSGAFLHSNLQRLWLGELTRERVAGAEPLGELLQQFDGTPVLRHRGALLGEPSDDLWLDQCVRESPSDSAFIVFGLGFGHTARALRALTDAPILIYEPDPGLARRALSSGPSDLGSFPLLCSLQDLTQIWPKFGGNRENVTLITTPGYGELYQSEDRDLREAVTQLVQRSSVNDQTHRVRARDWISDVLANVELLQHSSSFLGLAQKYQNVPAFIVGAGPSLGKNVGLLADAAQKGIVFAVNSSALALYKHGITPQVVACMESIDVSHLLEQVPYLDRVVRAFSLTGHPKMLRTGQGPLLPLYEGLPQLSPLAKLCRAPGLAVCGSVSTAAFALAQRLGCSPIVLVGQDLAYTEGRAYAAGTPYEDSRVKLSADGETLEHDRCDVARSTNGKLVQQEPLREVRAWGGGGTVLSTVGFGAVRSWLELAAQVIGRTPRPQRLINATEGGAHIAGFEELGLGEVLAGLEPVHITPEALAQGAREARPPLSAAELGTWVRIQLEGARRARHAARRVRRVSEAARRAVKSDDPRATRLAFARLEDAERQLRTGVASSPFVDAYSWAAVDAVMADAPSTRDDSRASAEHSIELEARLALAIETSTRELESQLERLEKTLGRSLPRPDSTEINQWHS